jgi:D-alanyl-D-alanine carboxypeptidase
MAAITPVAEPAPAPAAPQPVATAPGRITAAPLAPVAAVATVPAASGQAAAHPAEGSAEPIRPYRVKTIAVKAGPAQAAAYAPLVSSAPQATIAPTSLAQAQMRAPQQVAALPPPPGARPGVLGVLPAHAAAEPAPEATYQIASAYAPAPAPAPRTAATRGAWIVQIGAFPEEGEARERLRAAQNLARGLLAKADPFTEKVTKGRTELYRARFAVLDEETAEAACKVFKKNEIACFTTKN